jgi:hypothetical protein
VGRLSATDFLGPAGLTPFPDLMPPAALARAGVFLARMPGSATHTLLLECRLGVPAGAVDLSAQSLAANAERERLLDFLGEPADPADWRQGAAGRSIHDFVAHWSDPRSVLFDKVDNVWLECDLAADASPVPALFVYPQYVPPAGAGPATLEAIMRETLAPFAHLAPAPRASRLLQRCLEQIPWRKQLGFYLGLMLSRETSALRLVPRSLQPDTVRPYLREIGFDPPGAAAGLRLLDDVLAWGGMAFPALDVGEEFHPGFGLECFFRRQPWAPLLDFLVDAGLCLPEKRAQLLTFAGIERRSARPAAWPETFADLAAFLPADHEPCMRRSLSHIKVAVRDGRLVEAKAYLEVAFFWLSPSALEPAAS